MAIMVAVVVWYRNMYLEVKTHNNSFMWYEPQYVIPFYFEYIKNR